jgi:hypothetical protein
MAHEVRIVDHLDLMRRYFEDNHDDTFKKYLEVQHEVSSTDASLTPCYNVDLVFGHDVQSLALQHYLDEAVPRTWRLLSLTVVSDHYPLMRSYRFVWWSDL